MDTRTGKIHQMSDADAETRSHLTRLTSREHELIGKMPSEDRPRELALLRFIEEREKLGAPVTVALKNAFRLGYKAALTDRSET
jgi:hypothetical protein